jgi:hypothetical protein
MTQPTQPASNIEEPSSPTAPTTAGADRSLGLWIVAAILLLVVTALALLDAIGPDRSAARLLGTITGTLVVAAIPVVIYRVVARRPRRRTSAFIVIGTAALVLLGQISRLQRSGETIARRDAMLRQDVEYDGAAVRHPELGFTATFPIEGFGVDSALQRKALAGLVEQPRMRGWVFTRHDSLGVAMIQVTSAPILDERFMTGFSEGISGTAVRAGLPVVEDTLAWNDSLREFRFTAGPREDGTYMRGRCLGSPRARVPEFVVCAMTLNGERDELSPFRESLAFIPQSARADDQ